jgi:hypothetical protein
MTRSRTFRIAWLAVASTMIAIVIITTLFLCQSIPLVLSPSNVSTIQKLGRIDKYAWEMHRFRDGSEIALVGWETPIEIRSGSSFRLLRQIGVGQKIIHFAFGSGLHSAPGFGGYRRRALSRSASLPNARSLFALTRANFLTPWYLAFQMAIGVDAR